MRLKLIVLFCCIAICLGALAANCADMKCDKCGNMMSSDRMMPSGGPGDGMGMRGQMMNDLNLTQFQKDKMMELRSQFEESTKDLKEEMRKNNEELDMLWKVENPDADAIKAKAAQGNEIRAKIQNMMIDNQIKFFSMLTPEQKATARPHMNMMMGPGMGGGMMEPGMRPMGPGKGGMREPGMKPMGPRMGKMKGMKPGMCCPKCGTCPMCNKKAKPAMKKSSK